MSCLFFSMTCRQMLHNVTWKIELNVKNKNIDSSEKIQIHFRILFVPFFLHLSKLEH